MLQLTSSNSITLDAAAARILESVNDQPNTLIPVLRVGNVLEVEAGHDPRSGQRGIFLREQFIAAQLPPGVEDGQRLDLKVLSNKDNLVLQILTADKLQAGTEQPVAINQAIKSIISESALSELRGLLLLLATDSESGLPVDLLPADKFLEEAIVQESGQLETEPHPSTDKARGVGSGNASNAFSKLSSGQLFISEAELDSPQSLENLLLKFSADRISAAITEAKDSLQQLAETAATPAQLALLTAIDQQLDLLLDHAAPLSFAEREQGSENNRSSSIRLLLAVSHFAHEASNAAIIDKLITRVDGLSLQHNLLAVLHEALLDLLKLRIPESSVNDRGMLDVVRQIVSELQQLKDSQSTDVDIRMGLAKIKTLLKDRFGIGSDKARQDKAVNTTLNALQALEGFAHAQELLNQLNPMAQALGEPALIFLPALLQGVLTRWEVVVQPHRPHFSEEDDESSGGKKRKAASSFQRIELRLNFPKFGQVKVDLAHRQREILLNLTVAGEAAALFLQQRLPALDKIFHTLGYEKSILRASSGEVGDIVPSWFQDTIRSSIIA